MQKIYLLFIFIFPFIFAGCGEETTTTASGNITKPVTETASFTQTVMYSVLKKDKNTTASAEITGASENAGDTINVIFPDTSAENFTVSQGYILDDVYGIFTYRNSKETSVDKFNVSVKNRLGTEILNKTGYIFTVHKIYPCYFQKETGNIPIPYPDNYSFKVVDHLTILFRQATLESNESYENGAYIGTAGHKPVSITSYGFDSSNLNNSSTNNNFSIDNVAEKLDYNGNQYPNCLKYKGTEDYCALKITKTNGGDSAVFYMHINDTYEDTAIRLSPAQ